MNLENFPESLSGKRMLGMVNSGWYDRSYIGKWMFQVIGMEMDDAKEKFEELRRQAFLETADWGLCYWEKKYGISGSGNRTVEERRNQIREKQCRRYSMSPERLRQFAAFVSGKEIQIEEEEPYTFKVKVMIHDGSSIFRGEKLKKAIDRVKPAHLSYEIVTERPVAGSIYAGAVIQESEIMEIRQVV